MKFMQGYLELLDIPEFMEWWLLLSNRIELIEVHFLYQY